MQWTNGRFPTILSTTLSQETLLIHASSDAVFGSHASGCLWNDSFSPDTDYGYSKVAAEKGLVGENNAEEALVKAKSFTGLTKVPG